MTYKFIVNALNPLRYAVRKKFWERKRVWNYTCTWFYGLFWYEVCHKMEVSHTTLMETLFVTIFFRSIQVKLPYCRVRLFHKHMLFIFQAIQVWIKKEENESFLGLYVCEIKFNNLYSRDAYIFHTGFSENEI